MAALLELISPKVVFWGIVLALLLAFGVHYKHLEDEVSKAKVVAVQAQVQVKAVDKTAEVTETKDDLDYITTIARPPHPSLGIKCVRNNAGGSALPAAGPVQGAPVGSPAPDSGAGRSYDPSGAALARAAAADAQIKYLQGRIHELETQMNNSP